MAYNYVNPVANPTDYIKDSLAKSTSRLRQILRKKNKTSVFSAARQTNRLMSQSYFSATSLNHRDSQF